MTAAMRTYFDDVKSVRPNWYPKENKMNQYLKCINCYTPASPGVPCPVCRSISQYDDKGALVWTVGEPYAPAVTEYQPPAVDREDLEDRLPDALLEGGEDSPVLALRCYESVPREPAGRPWAVRRQVEGVDLDSMLQEPDAPRLPSGEAHRGLSVGPDLDELLGGGAR